MKYNILIGVPVLNNIEITEACIKRVIKNTETDRLNLGVTLLIIDNGSHENIVGLLQDKIINDNNIKIYYRKNPINLGVGIAWNQILKFSPDPIPKKSLYYNYYVILNNDALCCKDWLQPMVQTMESDNKIGWLACLENGTRLNDELIEAHTLTKKFKIQPGEPYSAEIIEENIEKNIYKKWGGHDSFCRHIKKNINLPDFIPFKGDMHSAVCFMVRPEMVDQIGFFDEDKPPIGVPEDLEYFLRMEKILRPDWLTNQKYPDKDIWKRGFSGKSIVHHNFWSCSHQKPNFDGKNWVKTREKNWRAKFRKSKKYFTKLLP